MTKSLLQHIALTTTTTLMGTTLLWGSYAIQTAALNTEESKTSSQLVKRDRIQPIDILLEFAPNSVATLQAYQWKGQKAIIVRVNDIPVLMFLSSLNSSEAQQNLAQAKRVTQRLNQFALQGGDASQITVSWDRTTQGYSIKIAEEELIQVNQSVLLPDTTNNLAQDALQATNRLRRLLGNALPLAEVENLPTPSPSLQPRRTATASSPSRRLQPVSRQENYRPTGVIRQGIASWYGPGFHGRRTANGERYNQHGLTAAHRYLPFGTKVRVTNLRNGRSVVVRINDRGPFSPGRIIDLSAGAAKTIGVFSSGLAPVKVEVLGR